MPRGDQSRWGFVLAAFIAISCARGQRTATSLPEPTTNVAASAPKASTHNKASTATNETGGAVAITWSTNAAAKRGKTGWTGLYSCPAGGTAGSVWGSGVFTDDSSICTAAVHAGVITLAGGGTARVAVQAGEPSYQGSTSNGITSNNYGTWAGSIVIAGGRAANPPPNKRTATKVAIKKIAWSSNATALRGKNGTRSSFVCPPLGKPSTVWGTLTYTDDSSICTAALHAGHIARVTGGRVTIEVTPGLRRYQGSNANGVASQPYGQWAGSYVFR